MKENIMKRIAFIIACLSLVACSQSLPVRGRVEQTSEPFVGTASGNIFGQGSLVITMYGGITCKGEFASKVAFAGTAISSQGLFNCSDGRTGNFMYSGTVHNGNGFGTLSDGSKIIFTYGN